MITYERMVLPVTMDEPYDVASVGLRVRALRLLPHQEERVRCGGRVRPDPLSSRVVSFAAPSGAGSSEAATLN